ncbi:protein disaggregation chaperone [Artemisia annua]|uniref:Protein disaggregation chaperone n=1 Tax=Artemisia annua TaxID=35608 RepID=A0A2U1NE27_ARTAN|nr:protein disaggregation chaperone [Artemisia annua]
MEGTLEKIPRKITGDFTNWLQELTKVLMFGAPGVGKLQLLKVLLKELCKEMSWSPSRTLISLDMGSLVAGAKYRGEFEERLKAVLKEFNTSNGQIGIFINEIHTVVSAGKQHYIKLNTQLSTNLLPKLLPRLLLNYTNLSLLLTSPIVRCGLGIYSLRREARVSLNPLEAPGSLIFALRSWCQVLKAQGKWEGEG